MSSGWKHWEQNSKQNYHPNFERRSLARKKFVKYTCELCWIRQGEEQTNKQGERYPVVVSAAHVNHDPWNPRAELIILCPCCHLDFDRVENSKKIRRTYYRKQREAALQSGQLELPLKRKYTARRKAEDEGA